MLSLGVSLRYSCGQNYLAEKYSSGSNVHMHFGYDDHIVRHWRIYYLALGV